MLKYVNHKVLITSRIMNIHDVASLRQSHWLKVVYEALALWNESMSHIRLLRLFGSSVLYIHSYESLPSKVFQTTFLTPQDMEFSKEWVFVGYHSFRGAKFSKWIHSKVSTWRSQLVKAASSSTMVKLNLLPSTESFGLLTSLWSCNVEMLHGDFYDNLV